MRCGKALAGGSREAAKDDGFGENAVDHVTKSDP